MMVAISPKHPVAPVRNHSSESNTGVSQPPNAETAPTALTPHGIRPAIADHARAAIAERAKIADRTNIHSLS